MNIAVSNLASVSVSDCSRGQYSAAQANIVTLFFPGAWMSPYPPTYALEIIDGFVIIQLNKLAFLRCTVPECKPASLTVI